MTIKNSVIKLPYVQVLVKFAYELPPKCTVKMLKWLVQKYFV